CDRQPSPFVQNQPCGPLVLGQGAGIALVKRREVVDESCGRVAQGTIREGDAEGGGEGKHLPQELGCGSSVDVKGFAKAHLAIARREGGRESSSDRPKRNPTYPLGAGETSRSGSRLRCTRTVLIRAMRASALSRASSVYESMIPRKKPTDMSCTLPIR